MNEYTPGICNIGPSEIIARKRVGWIGLALTIAFWALFIYFNLPRYWFALLFFPATVSATGFIQAYSHFCVAFGMKGLLNVKNGFGKTETVSQKEFRAKDQRKAIQIIISSVLVGAIMAVLVVYL